MDIFFFFFFFNISYNIFLLSLHHRFPYLFFVVLLGLTGVSGEMAFGRAMRSGPLGAFKKALEGYKPKPASYEDSPFYSVQNDLRNKYTHQGFAYYTYGEDGSINMFTYVNENKVYQSTREGKTWQDITPGEK